MRESSPSNVVAVTALILLAAGIGIALWLFSGPSVYASGHRWALYPLTGAIHSPDSSGKQEKLAFDENQKVFSLLYVEHLTDDQGEQIREALCHVVIDLPPGAILRITGGGGSDRKGFIYRNANIIIPGNDIPGDGIPGKDGKPPLETAMKLGFRKSDRRLAVFVGEEEFGAQLGEAQGNVFIVPIDEGGKVSEFVKVSQQVAHPLDADTLKQLMMQADTSK